MKFFRYSNAIAALCCMFLLGACKDSNDGIPDWPWEGDTDEPEQPVEVKPRFIWIDAAANFPDYANSKEKKYLLYNDEEARREYRSLLIIIFSILVIIYYHFTKNNYEDILKLNSSDTNKKIILTKASFIGTLLVLISGIIFLIIAIYDKQIEVELAFN